MAEAVGLSPDGEAEVMSVSMDDANGLTVRRGRYCGTRGEDDTSTVTPLAILLSLELWLIKTVLMIPVSFPDGVAGGLLRFVYAPSPGTGQPYRRIRSLLSLPTCSRTKTTTPRI